VPLLTFITFILVPLFPGASAATRAAANTGGLSLSFDQVPAHGPRVTGFDAYAAERTALDAARRHLVNVAAIAFAFDL
jgi:alkylhydroperoxidase/carboxymuconolactone decarboxylase family protein YurZ